MDILIRDAKDKRERLLIEIEVLEKEIQDTNLKEAIGKNYNILRDVLQKHQEYIKEKKMHKLRHDANDYVKGRVGGFWETRAAPVDYRQEKQKNAKVSDWVFLGFSLL
ncbi:hypothetical protein NDU88_010586 [Pleurodeles waltl]|uniref:Uncharacterized protein n=1 Tax=Pleurodeles waltl TaxID=8319 RepID=A0AAV7QWA9_PLEWA|nr:hypothetical protein NDU88_010586 [Pleurodeles waltl]